MPDSKSPPQERKDYSEVKTHRKFPEMQKRSESADQHDIPGKGDRNSHHCHDEQTEALVTNGMPAKAVCLTTQQGAKGLPRGAPPGILEMADLSSSYMCVTVFETVSQ